ncbi:ubiquitin-conjugating enzyme E2 D2B-like [Mya arenaria]|uniref:ubiquitin-conjugating enzyme E2 D2B-like n=1 Tax=Mya arenaria TaxID=6604 RepID=UPI0022E8FD23|nr:ubiquitin-conjugating enzyme E2 D2B-like [Mya arenaria]
MALKLLSKQLHNVMNELENHPGFSAGPLEDDMLHWEASIMGPENSPYEGGQFDLRIDFTVDYPLKPPKVWFLTKIFHPNVEADGKICADFLVGHWKPSLSISYMLMAICSLMLSPNMDNPAVQEIADLYMKDKDEFEKRAREMTQTQAKARI